MDTLKVTIRKASGAPVVDSETQAALGLLRTKLAADPAAVLHTYGLRSGAFEAVADVTEGLTEAQFRNFVDDLLPPAVIGWVSLQDDRGNPLYDAVIPETGDIEGTTHPAPPPRVSSWTVPRA